MSEIFTSNLVVPISSKGTITIGKSFSSDFIILTSKRALAEKDNKTESKSSALRNFIIFRQSNTFE